jgi:hypothetical protein
MIKHSRGNAIGSSRIHCKAYRRELEFFDLLNNGVIDEEFENQIHAQKRVKIAAKHAEHYKEVYRLHNTEVQDFFRTNAPKYLHVGKLEDSDKWKKLGDFLGIKVPGAYESHENITKT